MLSKKGGALPQMLTPFKMGVGGRIGSGKQWMSWVALDDVVSAIRSAIADAAMRGPVNVVAPESGTECGFHSRAGARAASPGNSSRAGICAAIDAG